MIDLSTKLNIFSPVFSNIKQNHLWTEYADFKTEDGDAQYMYCDYADVDLGKNGMNA